MANIDNGFRVEILSLDDKVLIGSGTADPSITTGYNAPQGSMYLKQDAGTSGSAYFKFGPADVDWTLIGASTPQGLLNVVEDLSPELGADLDALLNRIVNIADPVTAQGAATKNYVDLHTHAITELTDVLSSMIPAQGDVLTYNTLNGWQAEASNIAVKDEGIALANTPHTTLNFVGTNVTAVDTGTGEATITVTAASDTTYVSAHNSTVAQTFTASTVIGFNTIIRNDIEYTLTNVAGGTELSFANSGWYKIQYDITYDDGSNARTSSRSAIELNAVELPGSVSHGYHRNAAKGENSMSGSVLINVVANDIITVVGSGTGAITTVANGCRLNVESAPNP